MLGVLVAVFVVGLTVADNRLSWQIHETCDHNGVKYEHGQKFQDGCKDCWCEKNEVMCVQGSRCGLCKYVKPNGYTTTAKPGEVFWDGCRWCKCGDRGTHDCHMTGCPHKCPFKNRDGVDGFAQFFQVWYEGCHRCICRKGWSWQIGMGWAEKDCTFDCDQNWL